MDTLIKEYRTKHKKCKWCKYKEYINPDMCYPYDKCILKDKVINYDYHAIFCKYYTLKEDDN